MKKFTDVPCLVALFLLLVFSNIAVEAGPYKWVDKEGKINYSTSPPPEDEVLNQEPLPSADSAPAARASKTPAPRTKEAAPKAANTHHGDTISLNFNEVDLAKLFAIFADFSGNRINIDPSIRQTVAVHYFDVEWESTMYEIAARYNIAVTVENGTIYVRKKGSR